MDRLNDKHNKEILSCQSIIITTKHYINIYTSIYYHGELQYWIMSNKNFNINCCSNYCCLLKNGQYFHFEYRVQKRNKHVIK